MDKLGYKATLAKNGLEAVQIVQSQPGEFDLILMDCQMPVMSGSEATRRIRAMERKGASFARVDRESIEDAQGRIPIIALTANVSVESREDCEAAGMDLFLPKPLRMGELGDAIERTLRRKCR